MGAAAKIQGTVKPLPVISIAFDEARGEYAVTGHSGIESAAIIKALEKISDTISAANVQVLAGNAIKRHDARGQYPNIIYSVLAPAA